MTLQAIAERGLAAATRLYSHLSHGAERLGEPLAQAPAHANPVVIVPGFACDAGFHAPWQRSLAADGFDVTVLQDPLAGTGDAREAAQLLGRTVDDVLERTGARQVDLVTYSAGVTTARAYAQLDGGAPKVQRMVAVDATWRGDDDSRKLARIGSIPLIGGALRRAIPRDYTDVQFDSAVQRAINADGELPRGVAVTTVTSPADEHASHADGATNLVLRSSPSHMGIARSSAEAYETLRGALLA